MEDLSLPVRPVTAEQQQQIIDKTNQYILHASTLFGTKFKPVEISFNLKGRAAGMYRVSRNKREIRYNAHIFAKYYKDNFNTTIPHEVAHYITDIIYGLRNIRPHGKEWKAVMHKFNADASVTANFDLTGIPLKKQKLFTYACNCQEHQLSSVRHNKIKGKRGQYFCKHCKQSLQLKHQKNKAA